MTPTALALKLHISPKTLLAWLRRTFPRTSLDHGTSWILTENHMRAACHHWNVETPAPALGTSAQLKKRSGSDESYVLDLCDQLLRSKGERQHRFAWLSGDVCGNGRRVALPVDAFYEALGLVIEYRERQHDEPTPFFDRRHTVSGAGRGEQRRIYDHRREKLIPQHGLKLLVLRPSQLDCNSRGRLRRNREIDRKMLLKILFD